MAPPSKESGGQSTSPTQSTSGRGGIRGFLQSIRAHVSDALGDSGSPRKSSAQLDGVIQASSRSSTPRGSLGQAFPNVDSLLDCHAGSETRSSRRSGGGPLPTPSRPAALLGLGSDAADAAGDMILLQMPLPLEAIAASSPGHSSPTPDPIISARHTRSDRSASAASSGRAGVGPSTDARTASAVSSSAVSSGAISSGAGGGAGAGATTPSRHSLDATSRHASGSNISLAFGLGPAAADGGRAGALGSGLAGGGASRSERSSWNRSERSGSLRTSNVMLPGKDYQDYAYASAGGLAGGASSADGLPIAGARSRPASRPTSRGQVVVREQPSAASPVTFLFATEVQQPLAALGASPFSTPLTLAAPGSLQLGQPPQRPQPQSAAAAGVNDGMAGSSGDGHSGYHHHHRHPLLRYDDQQQQQPEGLELAIVEGDSDGDDGGGGGSRGHTGWAAAVPAAPPVPSLTVLQRPTRSVSSGELSTATVSQAVQRLQQRQQQEKAAARLLRAAHSHLPPHMTQAQQQQHYTHSVPALQQQQRHGSPVVRRVLTAAAETESMDIGASANPFSAGGGEQPGAGSAPAAAPATPSTVGFVSHNPQHPNPQNPHHHLHNPHQSAARRLGMGNARAASSSTVPNHQHCLYGSHLAAGTAGCTAGTAGAPLDGGVWLDLDVGERGVAAMGGGGGAGEGSGGGRRPTGQGGSELMEARGSLSFTEGLMSTADRLQALGGCDEATSNYLQQLLMPDNAASTASFDLQYSGAHSSVAAAYGMPTQSMLALAYGSSGGGHSGPAAAVVTAAGVGGGGGPGYGRDSYGLGSGQLPSTSSSYLLGGGGLLPPQAQDSASLYGGYGYGYGETSPLLLTHASSGGPSSRLGSQVDPLLPHFLSGGSGGGGSRSNSVVLAPPSPLGSGAYSRAATGGGGGGGGVGIAVLAHLDSADVDPHTGKSATQLLAELKETYDTAAAAAGTASAAVTAAATAATTGADTVVSAAAGGGSSASRLGTSSAAVVAAEVVAAEADRPSLLGLGVAGGGASSETTPATMPATITVLQRSAAPAAPPMLAVRCTPTAAAASPGAAAGSSGGGGRIGGSGAVAGSPRVARTLAAVEGQADGGGGGGGEAAAGPAVPSRAAPLRSVEVVSVTANGRGEGTASAAASAHVSPAVSRRRLMMPQQGQGQQALLQQRREELAAALWKLVHAKDSDAVSYLLSVEPGSRENRPVAPLLKDIRSWVYLNMW